MKITVDLEREELIAIFNAIDFEKDFCKDDINTLREDIGNLKNILDNNPNHPDGETIYYNIAEDEQRIEALNNHVSLLNMVEDKLNKSLPK